MFKDEILGELLEVSDTQHSACLLPLTPASWIGSAWSFAIAAIAIAHAVSSLPRLERRSVSWGICQLTSDQPVDLGVIYKYVYVYIYICICIYIYIYVYVYVHVYVNVYVYVYMHVCMYACMHVCMYVRMYVCMYVYTWHLWYLCYLWHLWEYHRGTELQTPEVLCFCQAHWDKPRWLVDFQRTNLCHGQTMVYGLCSSMPQYES